MEASTPNKRRVSESPSPVKKTPKKGVSSMSKGSSHHQRSTDKKQSNKSGSKEPAPQQSNVKIIEVDTLFIGGGPATLSVLSNAFHTQRVDELVLGSSPFSTAMNAASTMSNYNSGEAQTQPILSRQGPRRHTIGQAGAALGLSPNTEVIQKKGIAIVEMSDQFGGGNLQKHFGIRSNTSAAGFLKVLMVPRTESSPTGSPAGSPIPLVNPLQTKTLTGMFGRGPNLRSDSVPVAQIGQQTMIRLNQGPGTIEFKPVSNQGQQPQSPIQIPEPADQYLPQFVEFSQTSEVARQLTKHGKKIAPLQLIGTYMSYAGNAMLHHIWVKYQKKIFYGYHQAVRITQVLNSSSYSDTSWVTEVRPLNPSGPKGKEPVRIFFKSKNIVMATGAAQSIPPSFGSQYSLNSQAELYTSDEVLKLEGYYKLVRSIKKRRGNCKVAILGGSHSTFSIIYLLLYGPCKIKLFEDYQKRVSKTLNSLSHRKNASIGLSRESWGFKDAQSPKKPGASLKNDSFSPRSQFNQPMGPMGYSVGVCQHCSSCPMGLAHSRTKRCVCGNVCCCLSNPQVPPQSCELGAQNIFPILCGQDKVQIIYKNQIKVHYSNVQAAHQDLYYDFDSHLDLSKGGIVYPFTGIRGDAKELWQRIKNGNEKHIELIRADSAEHQRPYLRDADIVIVACGYHSVQVPIFDNNGYEINLATHHNRADRSTQIQKQRIAQMTQGNSMQNVAQTMINGPPGISDLYPPAVISSSSQKVVGGSQVEVTTQCQLMDARLPSCPVIPGLYGIGQGFSLNTNDISVQAEQRPGAKADSVGLYLKQIGNKILAQLLPFKKPRLVQGSEEPIRPQGLFFEKPASQTLMIPKSMVQPNQSQAGWSPVKPNPANLVASKLPNDINMTNELRATSPNYYPRTQDHQSHKLILNKEATRDAAESFGVTQGSGGVPFGFPQKTNFLISQQSQNVGRILSGNPTSSSNNRLQTGKSSHSTNRVQSTSTKGSIVKKGPPIMQATQNVFTNQPSPNLKPVPTQTLHGKSFVPNEKQQFSYVGGLIGSGVGPSLQQKQSQPVSGMNQSFYHNNFYNNQILVGNMHQYSGLTNSSNNYTGEIQFTQQVPQPMIQQQTLIREKSKGGQPSSTSFHSTTKKPSKKVKSQQKQKGSPQAVQMIGDPSMQNLYSYVEKKHERPVLQNGSPIQPNYGSVGGNQQSSTPQQTGLQLAQRQGGGYSETPSREKRGVSKQHSQSLRFQPQFAVASSQSQGQASIQNYQTPSKIDKYPINNYDSAVAGTILQSSTLLDSDSAVTKKRGQKSTSSLKKQFLPSQNNNSQSIYHILLQQGSKGIEQIKSGPQPILMQQPLLDQRLPVKSEVTNDGNNYLPIPSQHSRGSKIVASNSAIGPGEAQKQTNIHFDRLKQGVGPNSDHLRIKNKDNRYAMGNPSVSHVPSQVAMNLGANSRVPQSLRVNPAQHGGIFNNRF